MAIAANTGAVTWTNYLVAADGLCGMVVQYMASGVTRWQYFNKDHLGSVAVITNESGGVVERLGFDAWGKRRYANGSDDTSGSITSETNRGFTGHEELDLVGLVHMNGRVYDPVVARFTSADPMTENPFSTQGWNRYSYVGNSPLNFTDPSGYCFAGCFWKPVLSGIQKALVRSPILRVVVQVVLVALCEGNFACALLVSAATSAAVTGITGGNLSQSLRAGLIAATSAVAFNAVGDFTGHTPSFGSDQYLANVAGHAAVGCGMAVASGGKCGQGAAGAAVGAAGAPLISSVAPNFKSVGSADFFAGAAISAGLGGLGSIASGGKFATGAETAAFGYLYNQAGPSMAAGLGLGSPANLEGNSQAWNAQQQIGDAYRQSFTGIVVDASYGGEATIEGSQAWKVGGLFSIGPDGKPDLGLYWTRAEMVGQSIGAGPQAGIFFGSVRDFQAASTINISGLTYSGSIAILDGVPRGISIGRGAGAGLSFGPTKTCVATFREFGC